MKAHLLIATAVILLAPSAWAVNSSAISGSNVVDGINSGVITQNLGAGSGSTSTTLNPVANGGAGGNATANGGAGGSVIGSGNSSSVANGGAGGQGGRGGDGGTGIGLGGVGVGGSSIATGGSQSQSATTGSQSINVQAAERNAPPVYAPGLTSGIDTCLGSASAGLTLPIGGFTGGGTVTDRDCVRIKMSRELDLRGYRDAGVAMLCFNDEVRAAMATAGTPCAGEPAVASSERKPWATSGESAKH